MHISINYMVMRINVHVYRTMQINRSKLECSNLFYNILHMACNPEYIVGTSNCLIIISHK